MVAIATTGCLVISQTCHLLVGLLLLAVVIFAAAVNASVRSWVASFNDWTANTFRAPVFDSSAGTSDAGTDSPSAKRAGPLK